MRKAQRQENDVANQPPRSGPSAAVPPMVAPQKAKAMPRSLPRKPAFSSDSEVLVADRVGDPDKFRAELIRLVEQPGANTDRPTSR